MLFGFHINSSYDMIIKELKKAKNTNANIIQLFIDPSHSQNNNLYINFRDMLISYNIKCIVHASYTINLAKHWDTYSPHIIQLIEEIKMATLINAIGIVIHLGKTLELSQAEALNNMYSSLLYIHNQTKEISNIKIFIETSSGQGSEMCFLINDFAHFFKKFIRINPTINDRFRICIDTCHIFASGYDIRNKKTITNYLNLFEKLIGIKYIGLIHLNDSKNDLNSHLDRHESIGKGYIGKNGLKIFADFFKKLNVPIILETPNHNHSQELLFIT